MAIASPSRLRREKADYRLLGCETRDRLSKRLHIDEAWLILIVDNYVCTRVDRFLLLVICWILLPTDQTAIVCNRDTLRGINIPRVICINYHRARLKKKKNAFQPFKVITHAYFFNRLRNLSLLVLFDAIIYFSRYFPRSISHTLIEYVETQTSHHD